MWILPSRGRPHNVKRFFEHWKKTESSTPGVLVIDEDEYKIYDSVELPDNWSKVIYPRMTMCGKSNRAFNDFPGKDWYGFVDDDAVPQTMHWDALLVEAAGKGGLSHCWNGIGNERLASQFVIGGDLARELGWIFLPGLSRIYGDDVITAIADRKGVRKYLPDVKLEQQHFSNGKSEMDSTYLKPEAGEDRRVYMEWLSEFQKPVTFVCLKAGDAYGPKYVNILNDMVRRNLSSGYPGRFVCITDNTQGLDDDIETLQLPDGLPGWWGKLYMFKRGLFKDGERLVFLDLDTIILGKIDYLASYSGQFATLRDFYYPSQVGPAIIAWEAGDFAASIWEEWDSQGRPMTGHGDLWWINNLDQGRFVKKIDILQDKFPGKFCSYKADCHPYPPNGTAVVCFHGQPKQDNCGQEWVESVWKIGGSGMAELDVIANTNNEIVKNQVLSACERDIPWIGIKEPHDGVAVIVAGGPSLLNTMEEVRLMAKNGAHLFAVNNTAKLLQSNDIWPQAQVIIDARPENAEFVTCCQQHYFASQCHPSVFDAATNATLFHMNTEGIAEILPKDREANLISSGTTVGLAAMILAYVLGYRIIHLHGFDSSYTENHHAYEQKSNDVDVVVDVLVGDRKFKSAAWMVKQAQQFQELALQLSENGAIITVAGDGLLPYIAHCMANQ